MGRKLHLGGKVRKEGWEVFNAIPGDAVDHVGNANDLSRFPDGTFDELYGSHIVEHFDYKDELKATLKEWHRVLKTGGQLYVSVPDLDTLCTLILDARLQPSQRFHVMRMMFGGHVDQWDYHKVGLNQEFLGSFLVSAGFAEIRRVRDFGIFADTSGTVFNGILISLNLIAFK